MLRHLRGLIGLIMTFLSSFIYPLELTSHGFLIVNLNTRPMLIAALCDVMIELRRINVQLRVTN